MSKMNVSNFSVRYPGKEKALAVVNEGANPFRNAVIGITNPIPYYEIYRSAKLPVNVFEYVLEGEGEILIGDEWQKVSEGQVYILRQGEAHRYRSNPDNPWKKIWINYVADYISSFLDAYGIQSGVYSAEDARVYFERVLEYVDGGAPYVNSSYNIADCVHGIIGAVALERSSGGSDEDSIREALNSAVYEKLNLDSLSSSIHISKSNIIRIFKKRYGVTPYEYLLSLKISTAKILLKDTQITVKEISERLCFSDEHYFSNVFFSRTGMRPRDYRSVHRKSL